MSRNLIILIIIFAVLIGLAMFVLIPDRGNDDATTEGAGEVDPNVSAQQTADAAAGLAPGGEAAANGRTSEVVFVDGRQVTLNYEADRRFDTETERNGFSPRPDDSGDSGNPQPDTPQPEATVVIDQNVPTATPLPPQPENPGTSRSGDPIIFTQYTVAGGETMFSLSQRTDFNTSIGLMALYGIDTTDFTQGNVLNIPIVNPGYCVNARVAHLILEGENVFRIAERYGVTQEAIRAANGLDAAYSIKTNEVLCIP